jgi:hypothetical protein
MQIFKHNSQMAASENKNKSSSLRLETWLLQAADSPASPFTPADFNSFVSD